MKSKWEVRTRNIFIDGQWRFDRKYGRGEHIVEFSDDLDDTVEFDGESYYAVFLCGPHTVILANHDHTARIEIEKLAPKKLITPNS